MNIESQNQFWHDSVVLNTEFMIATDFIFYGLENLINVTYFQSYSESKIFTAYYKLAVGIERVQKIILNLAYNNLEKENKIELNERIEKAFHSHNHENLHKLLVDYTETPSRLEKDDNKFISKLMEFYNKYRYAKYQEDATQDLFYSFHLGQEYTYGRNERMTVKINSVFDSLERILTFYFRILKKLQGQFNNYLGEGGSDTKMSIIHRYSRWLKRYFQLLSLAKFEYQQNNSAAIQFESEVEKEMADIDIYFGGNGGNAVFGLLKKYYDCEISGIDLCTFYSRYVPGGIEENDKDFKQKRKKLDKIISYFSQEYPQYAYIWG